MKEVVFETDDVSVPRVHTGRMFHRVDEVTSSHVDVDAVNDVLLGFLLQRDNDNTRYWR